MIGHHAPVANFAGVVSTGIYCRPSCGAHPSSKNVYGFTLAASAEAAGYRACLKCRPYRSQPPPSWEGPEVVCRAVRLILHGALDNTSELDLADRLSLSARHLRRLFAEHLGVTPDQLARSTRAHFARRLIDDTDFTMVEIAFMSGFGSVRQFNRACVEIFRTSPRELRARRRIKDRLAADGGLILRLPFQPPLDWDRMLNYCATYAIQGVEAVAGGTYRRTVVIDGDPGMLELAPGGSDHLLLRLHIPHWEGLIHIAQRARHIFNLDADLPSANRHLAADPLLKHLVSALPGVRPPGTWDGFETGVLTILGQRVSQAAMRTWSARIASEYGAPVAGLQAFGLKQTFPSPDTLAAADIGRLGVAPATAAAVKSFAEAVAAGTILLDGSQPLEELIPSLRRFAGVGPVAAHYIALRLGERDAFPISPGGLRHSLGRVANRPTSPDVASRQADGWRPWRAYAAALLRFGIAGEKPRARIA